MEQRMSVVTLGFSNLDRSQKFYERWLGWVVGAAEGRIRFFQLNGLILALYPRDALAEDAQITSDEKGFSGITLAYCARSKEEVDEILRRACNAGATIQKTAQEVFWGGYSGYSQIQTVIFGRLPTIRSGSLMMRATYTLKHLDLISIRLLCPIG